MTPPEPGTPPFGFWFSMLNRVGFSFVAGASFYFIVTHLKDRRDAATLRPYIAKKTRRIVGEACKLAQEMSKEAGVGLFEAR